MTETTRLDFTLFYDQHVERIYRYLLARLGAPADAEDLTAETFRAALEGYTRLRSDDSAAAWLVGIARHKLVDHFRRRKPVFSLEEAAERPHPGPTVEEMAGQRLEINRVSRMLALLNRERAEALALYYFAGLNLAEVGQSMGKSEEAAKKLVQRGLEELRQRLVSECR
jgi:RNA polymerase sigma-70 factor, ECF subfamily